MLFNRYIRPTLRYVHETTTTAFESDFNEFLDRRFLVLVDEAEMRERQARLVMARLKSYITEPYLPLRKLYHGQVEVPSYVNFIFASNRPDPLLIEDPSGLWLAKYSPHPHAAA